MSDATLVAECTLCATYYKTFRKLRRHLKKRHADLEALQCYFCDYITHDKLMFKQHKETLHAGKKFVCKICDYKTRKWTRMERHFDKHKTTKPVTEPPSSEDLSATSRVKETVHSTSRVKEDVHSTSRVKEAVQEIIKKLIKEEKLEKKLFNCNFCDKHFQGKLRLKEHVQVHITEHPFKCTLGKYKHKLKSINEIFTPNRLSCTVNDHSTPRFKETYNSTSEVKETVQEIIEEIKKQEIKHKSFVCEICKKCFQYKSYITQHLRIHTQDYPYKCTLCDFASKWKYNLAVHIQNHSDERPFNCSFCEYKANRAQYLTDHIKVNLNQRDFACEICDYKTFTKQYLQIHMRVHTGEKPFKCHICESAFSQRPTLKKHLRTIHQALSKMNHLNPQWQKEQN